MVLFYSVAAWFPEGYGGASYYSIEAEAIAAREAMLATGYKIVHVWKITEELIVGREGPAGKPEEAQA